MPNTIISDAYELAQRKTVMAIGTIRKDGKIAVTYGKLSKIRTPEQIVADIASDIAAVRVFLLYGIDPLKAVHSRTFEPPLPATRCAGRKSLRTLAIRESRCGSSHPGQPISEVRTVIVNDVLSDT